MTKPTILFLIPGLNVGGAERHTLDLRVSLEQRGFPTALVVHGRRRSATLLAHPGARDAVLLDLKGMSDPVGWLRVRAEVRRHRPDVIVGINQMPLVVAVTTRLMRGTSAKVVCIFHTTVLRENELNRFFLFRWALRLADALDFVSANQKAYWRQHGLSCPRMPVILNGIDATRFGSANQDRDAMRARFSFAAEDIVIGLVAAFRPEKNHELLISALLALQGRGRTFKLLFVGDGPTRPKNEKRLSELGLADLVVFAGEQSDVRAYMSACDLGVLCSNAVETFSLAAIEFLAVGVPMIMSRVGGATEIIQNEVNGFLVEAGSAADLADKIEAATEPEVLPRLRSAARASVSHLSSDAMAAKYSDLLEQLSR